MPDGAKCRTARSATRRFSDGAGTKQRSFVVVAVPVFGIQRRLEFSAVRNLAPFGIGRRLQFAVLALAAATPSCEQPARPD
jgi:hypothetical protein